MRHRIHTRAQLCQSGMRAGQMRGKHGEDREDVSGMGQMSVSNERTEMLGQREQRTRAWQFPSIDVCTLWMRLMNF